jgi:hypothetical protein
MPWRRRLVAFLSSRRPGFAAGPIHVECVVNKVTLGLVLLRITRVSPVDILPWLFILIYHLMGSHEVRWWPQFRDIDINNRNQFLI